jgi:hypothetical protein
LFGVIGTYTNGNRMVTPEEINLFVGNSGPKRVYWEMRVVPTVGDVETILGEVVLLLRKKAGTAPNPLLALPTPSSSTRYIDYTEIDDADATPTMCRSDGCTVA